jgi:pantoate--beta-alanine ligase
MVTLVRETAELRRLRSEETAPVGFVPTMGNLHEGHVSLLDRALREHAVVYFSIFVNPKQFGPAEDFARYPRTLDHDLALIEACAARYPAARVVVFAPADAAQVFPPGEPQTVSVHGLSTILEGKLRPGHFDGVATVVYELFALVNPATAYFGLKDYQQYLVIKQMVKDLCLSVKIQGMPIIREPEGLALSSRNQYLSPEQKAAGLILSQTLTRVAELVAGRRDRIPQARRFVAGILAGDSNWNYLELRDAETLSEDLTRSTHITILAVYQLGPTRLLDNVQAEVR